MKANQPRSQGPQRAQPAQGAQRPHRERGPKVSAGAHKVLRWLTQGHDLAAIARRLGRDEPHMKERLAALLARLGVDSPQAALDMLTAAKAAVPSDPVTANEPVTDEFSDIHVDPGEPQALAETADAAGGTSTR